MSAPRVLVAGVGNVLAGDDGFGVRVVEALRESGRLPSAVRVVEVGIGGIHLVQELMDGYDALVVVDAVDRERPPGTVYVLEAHVPEIDELDDLERSEFLADTHYAVPGKALMLARALDILPSMAYIVGCQPARVEPGLELSEVVEGAVGEAASRIRSLLADIAGREISEAPTPGKR